jgi:hypothetical protein
MRILIRFRVVAAASSIIDGLGWVYGEWRKDRHAPSWRLLIICLDFGDSHRDSDSFAGDREMMLSLRAIPGYLFDFCTCTTNIERQA